MEDLVINGIALKLTSINIIVDVIGQAYMDNNNHYNIIEKNEIENDITSKNSDNQIKKNYSINASNGKEKVILNNENNINGKIKHPINDKQDKKYNN